MPIEDKLWLPPLSPKDHKRLARIQSDGFIKATYKRIGFSGKTLWDWLQLLAVLAIPVVVAFVSISFSTQQDANNQRQHQFDLKIAQDNRQNDVQLANDQQQEATLKSYLDDMSDLLLNHNLRNSKPADEVRQVARERTLTTLRRLKADRNRIVLQFLQDAHIIGVSNAVLDFSGADLSGDDLVGVNLIGAHLDHANLSGADLHLAYLSNATLYGANLSNATLYGAYLGGADLRADLGGADLHHAYLSGADLRGANLSRTNLSGANLSSTNLIGAHLEWANLSGADLWDAFLDVADLYGATGTTTELLAQAKSLKCATMPDGSIHP